MMNFDNAYKKPLCRFSVEQENGVHQAFDCAKALYLAAEQERYRTLSRTEMAAFLDAAAALQTEEGLIPLVIDKTMPSDCRVDLQYHPSYAAAAAAIYAWQTMREIFDEARTAFFKNLLHGCTGRGLRDHGLDAGSGQRRNLILLAKADVKAFVEENGDLCAEFTALVRDTIQMFERDIARAKQNHTSMVEMGMWPVPITAELEQVVAAYHGKTHTLFVYGTLMQGQPAHDLLKDAVYSRRYTLHDHTMVDLGAYPGIVQKKNEAVLGEVYFVSPEMMAEMDRYEDEGNLYLRREVWVKSEQGCLRAEAYLYNKSTQGRLECSCWQPENEEEIWYACYGSNLSEERFRCYVQGGVAPNGKRYYGCNDTTLWKESYWTDYRGRLYFGNESPSWDYGGVAFYDPAGYETVLFRLYRITRDQLHDIMRQEGASANWYGHQFLLGMGKDNLPVYTLISNTTRPQKAPSPNYLEVIRTALEKEAGLKPKEVKRYLDKALNA